MNAGAGLEPGGGDDHRVHERALDTVVDRRLVAFVENAHRYQHHARANVETALDQKVDVRLLEFHLAGFFETLDKRVLQFELADKTDALREAVVEEQHKPVKIHARVEPLVLVEMEVHVSGHGTRGGRTRSGGGRAGRRRRLRLAGPGGERHGQADQRRCEC